MCYRGIQACEHIQTSVSKFLSFSMTAKRDKPNSRRSHDMCSYLRMVKEVKGRIKVIGMDHQRSIKLLYDRDHRV